MPTLRAQKAQLKMDFFRIRESLQGSIEDDEISEPEAMQLMNTITDLYGRYMQVSRTYEEEMESWSNVDQVAKTRVERTRIQHAFAETEQELGRYLNRNKASMFEDVSDVYHRRPESLMSVAGAKTEYDSMEQLGHSRFPQNPDGLMHTRSIISERTELNSIVENLRRNLTIAEEQQRSYTEHVTYLADRSTALLQPEQRRPPSQHSGLQYHSTPQRRASQFQGPSQENIRSYQQQPVVTERKPMGLEHRSLSQHFESGSDRYLYPGGVKPSERSFMECQRTPQFMYPQEIPFMGHRGEQRQEYQNRPPLKELYVGNNQGYERREDVNFSMTRPSQPVRHDGQTLTSAPLHFPRDDDLNRGQNCQPIGLSYQRDLQRIPLPECNGNEKEFSQWWSTFNTLVHSTNLPVDIKFLHLKNCLKEKTVILLQDVEHDEAGYGSVVQQLHERFGGERRRITGRLSELDNFKPIQEGEILKLRDFVYLINKIMLNMQRSGCEGELGSGSLYFTMKRKLPDSLLIRYHRWLHSCGIVGDVAALREYTHDEVVFGVEAIETSKGQQEIKTKFQPKTKTKVTMVGQEKSKAISTKTSVAATSVSTTGGENTQLKCRLCKGSHGLWSCPQFKKLPVQERWEKIKSTLHVCFWCLASGHRMEDCKFDRPCGIDGCMVMHHRLLHKRGRDEKRNTYMTQNVDEMTHDSSGNGDKDKTKTEQGTSTGNTDVQRSGDKITQPQTQLTQQTMMVSPDEATYIALRTVPVIVKNGDKSIQVNALMDDASNISYVSEALVQALQLTEKPEEVNVKVIAGKEIPINTSVVEITLGSVDGQIVRKAEAQTLKSITGDMQVIDWNKCKSKWPHIAGINFPVYGKRTTVDVLIGGNFVELHYSKKDIKGGIGEPIARLTPLGWTCLGTPWGNPKNKSTMFALSDLIRRFWEIEETSQANALTELTAEERKAEDLVKSSYIKVDGHYQVAIPWKDGRPDLPNNYKSALSRLENTERKLKCDSQLAEAYQRVISDYVQKGYVTKIEGQDIKAQAKWFLPHFPVVRVNKETSKVRPVFDASARYKNVSLNDTQLKGPNLQRDTVAVLTRFRRYPVSIACDIAEMYLQVLLDPKDRPYYRFLWRELQDTEPEQYQFNRVIFGSNCSPYLAQWVSKANAKEHEVEYPRAAETIIYSTYMDDSLDSVATVEEAIHLHHDLVKLWATAGMRARKWLSNSPEVLQSVPSTERASNVNLTDGELPVSKTLGIMWEAGSDCFKFVVCAPTDEFKITKRSFLSKLATVYDPLGSLGPFLIRGKIVLQQMWEAGADWDDSPPEEITKSAEKWFKEMPDLEKIMISRPLQIEPEVVSTQLHCFSDASELAYGAVAYVRHQYPSGAVSVRQVLSKNKVAPLKTVSIPRLELMGAVISTKLASVVAPVLEIPRENQWFWMDSMDVVYWMHSSSRTYKPFVANRIGEIQRRTEPDHWKYINTSMNPADQLSRGSTAENLQSELWWYGPDFLQLSESDWPVKELNLKPDDDVEKKKTVRITMTTEARSEVRNLSLRNITLENLRLSPECWSRWVPLIRSFACVHRYLQNNRLDRANRITGPLQPLEIEHIEQALWRMAQTQGFTREKCCVLNNKVVPSSSKIKMMAPWLDDEDLLRGGSRIQYADYIPWETKFPILLPRRHPITALTVTDIHLRCGHGGVNQTLCDVLKRFWIPAAREVVREMVNQCRVCRKRNARPADQIMAPLP